MNPAQPCNPFGGLARLTTVERRLAELHFLVDTEVGELKHRHDNTKQEAEKFQKQLDYQAASFASIDEYNLSSIDRRMNEIDGRMKLLAEKLHESLQQQPSTDARRDASTDVETSEFCTRADLDKLADEVYTAITNVDDMQDKCRDQLYFPLNNTVGNLESCIEGLQKEIKDIKWQLMSRPAPTPSIDRRTSASPDGRNQPSTATTSTPSIDTNHIIHDLTDQRLDAEQGGLTAPSAHANGSLEAFEFHLESRRSKLQQLRDDLDRIQDRRTKEYDAQQSQYNSMFGEKKDSEDACLPASSSTSSP